MPTQKSAQIIRKSLVFTGYVLAAVVAISLLSRIGPIGLRLFVPLLLIGTTIWLLWSAVVPPGSRIERHLHGREFERAFLLAMKKGQGSKICDFLREDLPLPADVLRASMVATFNELRALHASAYDPANTFISAGLKRAMQESSDEARNAFWGICRNLAVVAHQKVKFADDHHKIQHLNRSIEELKVSAGSVRVKLAELSLGATDAELDEAAQAIENVRRQSEALLELEATFG